MKKYLILMLRFFVILYMTLPDVCFAYGQIAPPYPDAKRISGNSGEFQVKKEDFYAFPNVTGPVDKTGTTSRTRRKLQAKCG